MALVSRLLPASIWLLSGCSPVTKSGPDGGNGAVCLGELDQSGACVCGPRASGELCEECPPGWSNPEGGCSLFSDDFERPPGALGPAWAVPDLGVPPAEIVDGRACGDTQSVAVLAQPIASRDFAARFDFLAEVPAGLEVTLLFADNDDLLPTFIAGCDGGGDRCLLYIGRFGDAPLVERDIDLAAGETARFELGISDAEVSLRVTQPDLVPQTMTAPLPGGFEAKRVGFVVGREDDGRLSCIDDLSLELR